MVDERNQEKEIKEGIIVITTHEEHKKGGYFQKGCDECAKFIGHGVMKGTLKPECAFEICPECRKPMCFERRTEDMPHEYDVCNECGKHVCICCSKMIDETPYCPDCYNKLPKREI
jgi:hypothetical protein